MGTVAGMVATDSPTADSTAAATTAKGKLRLRLTPPSARGVRTRGGLLTGAATATATATATSPPTPGATPDLTQSPQDLQYQQLQPFLRQLLLLKEGSIEPMASF